MTGKLTPARQRQPGLYYGYVVVAVAFIVMMLSQGLFMVFGVFFDPLLKEFGWTRAMLSGAYSLSSVLSGVMGIGVGWLSDRFGSRVVVTAGGFLLGLGYVMVSQVSSLWQFYLYYGVVVGIGMGGLWIPLLSPIVRWFEAKRSLMTAIVLTGLTVGQFIAPPIISRLIGAQGWRTSYMIMGFVVMLIIIICAQFLKRNPDKTDLQILNEKSIQEPDVPISARDFTLKEAIRTPQFLIVAVLFFCVGYSAFSIIVHLVPDAILLGISDITAANILAVSGGIGIIGNLVIGGLAGDRLGNRAGFLAGMTLVTASLFGLIYAEGVWPLYLIALVFGIGLGGMGTSESPLIARLFGQTSHGAIYGVVGLSWTAGGAIGPFVTGFLCDLNGNYQFAFIICAIIAAIGLLLLFLLKPTSRIGNRL